MIKKGKQVSNKIYNIKYVINSEMLIIHQIVAEMSFINQAKSKYINVYRYENL